MGEGSDKAGMSVKTRIVRRLNLLKSERAGWLPMYQDWIIHYFDRKEVTRAPYYGECRLAPFHLLLNMAGNWGKDSVEKDAAVSPIDLFVDYVKVWTE